MNNDLGSITTICFDADGTLWDHETAMRQALAATLEELCRYVVDVPEWVDVEQLIAIRNEVGEQFRAEDFSLDDLRALAFRRTLELIGVRDLAYASYLTVLYQRKRLEVMSLYRDVLATLGMLGQSYTLGIVTNGTTNPGLLGLRGRFGFVVMSEDYGIEKPDPRIFDIAMEHAGCSPAQALHVGDSLEHDVEGAHRAGLVSVWLNRNGDTNNSPVEPHYEISSLGELLDLLRVREGA